MNREAEEQRPVAQTFCGALQKEPNCKCLVLSVLIYGCLAAVTWCRCANVAKIIINFSKNPIKSTKNVSPCDDGYIYIPVAFMGMLYLVYLVECYHSPIRIDLLHGESQESVLTKLMQFRLAQPTIWWKAISYHYVRRKRQITRYRNGDNYTTTQVYYERVNTHAATSFYYYDYAGVKDISKDLILEPKIPITKINLTKGFAFSNIRSATEFEEARSRFFAEQELRDDYMEMREGLDLGYNVNPATLVAVLGNPWFTNSYVYWCLSALLLSWPLRVIIEYNTQYADYQVTKLFGVNYDTPSSGEPIHASTSQLSQPGSYMLAPSYSEALLMEPAEPSPSAIATEEERPSETDMVPSYSEALLYQRADGISLYDDASATQNATSNGDAQSMTFRYSYPPEHGATTSENATIEADPARIDPVENRYGEDRSAADVTAQDCQSQESREGFDQSASSRASKRDASVSASLRGECSCSHGTQTSADAESVREINDDGAESNDGGQCSRWSPICGNCREFNDAPTHGRNRLSGDFEIGASRDRFRAIPREISEPNLRSRAELMSASTQFLRANGRSLENILENEEEPSIEERNATIRRPNGLRLETLPSGCVRSDGSCRGAIPKRVELRARVTVNPMSSETCRQLTSSKTYFCLKSILKQNSRRYTLVTTHDLQNIGGQETTDFVDVERNSETANVEISRDNDGLDCDSQRNKCRVYSRSRESLDSLLGCKRKPSWRKFADGRECKTRSLDQRHDSYRTLIFASPIQEVCPDDPFGGKNVVPSKRDYVDCEEISNFPVLTRLRRSLTERETPYRRAHHYRKHQRTYSVEPEYLFPSSTTTTTTTSSSSSSSTSTGCNRTNGGRTNGAYWNGVSFPPYDGFVANGSRGVPRSSSRSSMNVRCLDADVATGTSIDRRGNFRPPETRQRPHSCEVVANEDPRSPTSRRTNLNMETSL